MVIDNPLLQLMDQYKDAVHAKNVDAFVALYDDDLHVFDMWGRWSLRGIEAWRKMAVEWFASLGTERVVVDINEAEITQLGELAVGHAILTYTAFSANGEKLRWLNNRISLGLRKSNGGWKIFHEHTSVPIDHQSMKALLQRAVDG